MAAPQSRASQVLTAASVSEWSRYSNLELISTEYCILAGQLCCDTGKGRGELVCELLELWISYEQLEGGKRVSGGLLRQEAFSGGGEAAAAFVSSMYLLAGVAQKVIVSQRAREWLPKRITASEGDD